ncbi:MAG TPA: hypothetical protein VFS28_03340 [Gemmatimonadales bacterium]|nr:hypothetical protein [Gemmatimonadales bacterium]
MTDRDLPAAELVERVRAELIRAAIAAYEDAAMRGLCDEGAFEVAVSAMRRADLSAVQRPPA